ncbi:hypothetical protein DYBT9275_05989 [Dyadobacter sp. CECT 9275]|uniref:tRNA pseudouridine32 synthase / 23S rRNA pseudouridine746 synthase n=1 Tax=Dyadobacter helix TaxID=2822344 RepID=A0A916JIF4_9BACT|nr:pseudouridylate synthase [Dyadobacter sp. CECT 9275]CAG5018379.1 hypothetical protein DYBT9275_05989 [Dyadobacter sp. CECT 9275]
MKQAPENLLLHSFDSSVSVDQLPVQFTFPFDYTPHRLSLLAARGLQEHLSTQQDWDHHFGLSGENDRVSGKMFGVLVVRTPENSIGYLAAFSGKLAGSNHHAKFVPPVYDGLADDGFLNTGMTELSRMNEAIKVLKLQQSEQEREQIALLKDIRKKHSVRLQSKIFDHYHFLNRAGEEKGLRLIFDDASYKNPPAGAGECAAPKLLQYAFQHRLEPLAMAEFWWGLSPKSAHWKHGHFYPACQEKCAPILSHMLAGMNIEKPAR